MPKSAKEKLSAKKETKKVVLDFAFGGMKPGQKMFVGTPQIIDSFIRKIPFGETRTVYAMRNALARKHGCDGTCPVSTAMFVRISAEAALEEIADGANVSDVAPFWRLLEGGDKIAKRLPIDGTWIDEQRALEAEHKNTRQAKA